MCENFGTSHLSRLWHNNKRDQSIGTTEPSTGGPNGTISARVCKTHDFSQKKNSIVKTSYWPKCGFKYHRPRMLRFRMWTSELIMKRKIGWSMWDFSCIFSCDMKKHWLIGMTMGEWSIVCGQWEISHEFHEKENTYLCVKWKRQWTQLSIW
jgi:hypothetical protein